MAYELYITRAALWSANQGRKISRAEWDHLVAEDSTLAPESPDDEAPAQVQWRCAPEALPATLAYDVGNILCTNPDEPTLAKLLTIAGLLNAQLQGRDGEIYSSPHDRPELEEASLFERAAWPLRIRFPQLYQIKPTATAAVEPVAEPAPEPEDPSTSRPAPRRMTIPFPNTARPPSSAILTLLKAAPPPQFPAPPGLIRAS